MALSNWDTCAFDSEGKPTNGVITKKHEDGSHSGVEIYKNWLYVRDTAMWVDGRSYVEPTIAEVHEGRSTIAGFRIYAKRGPQQSVLAFVETGWRHSDRPEAKYDCMCGIGCYGFEGEQWVGVQRPTFAALLAWLGELMNDYIVEEDYMKLIENSDPLRFNQGDGYFADNTGHPELSQVTRIGEANQPIILSMLGAGKEGQDSEADE